MSAATSSSKQTLAALQDAARAAGAAALPFFNLGSATTARIDYKNNNSPVTEGDFAADAAARTVLDTAFAGVPILSEEDKDHYRIGHGRVLVMDPIDGTRAFISGRTEWCVSLAMLEDGQPVAGVVFAPARKQMMAAARGLGATMNGEKLLLRPVQSIPPLVVTGPARALAKVQSHWPKTAQGETYKALAYRLASVAAGMADVAVALEGANHWDIAAAQILLSETGCLLRSLSGAAPVYNGTNPVHPALIAAEAGLCGRLTDALAH